MEKKKPPVHEFEDDAGRQINLIAHAIRQCFNRLFEGNSLTYPQSRVLTYLFDCDNGEAINQRRLERELGIKASSVSSLVHNLEQNGMIHCERSEEDSRNKQIYLTESGRALKKITKQTTRQVEARLCSGITPEKLAITKECLQKMVENLSQT